jgi:hypothetical protein
MWFGEYVSSFCQTYISFVPVVESGSEKSVGVDTVERRQFVVFEYELQLCDAVVIALFIEKVGDCVEALAPVGRIGEGGCHDEKFCLEERRVEKCVECVW